MARPRNTLRIPAVLTMALVGAGASAATIASCGSEQSAVDAPLSDGIIVDQGGSDAGACPADVPCADADGNCPPGCRAVG